MRPNDPSHPLTLAYGKTWSVSPWRARVALALSVPAGLAAGYALLYTTLGTVAAWFSLTLLCPTLLCMIASSRHLLVAGLYQAAMAGVVLLTLLRLGAQPRPGALVFLLTTLALLSLAIAKGVAAIKRPAA